MFIMNSFSKLCITMLFAALFLLVGCGTNNADTAVRYLEALNQRDIEAARGLVCEVREDDVTMGLMSAGDLQQPSFSFSNVSCTARADDVLCRFTIEQFTEGAELTGIQRARQVVFDFEDGKVCGFEEQVAQ